MRKIQIYKDYAVENKRFFNVVNYHLARREYDVVKGIIMNPPLKDTGLIGRLSGLFLLDPRAIEWFGIGENIIGSISSMVFGGKVKLVVEHKVGQKLVDDIYYDGYFMDKIKETYETALTDADGKAYLFFNTRQEYNNVTGVKIKDEFLDFDVFPNFEIEKKKNILIRTFYQVVDISKNKSEVWKFEYVYETLDNDLTILNVYGYDDEDERVSDELVVAALGIDTTREVFSFVPYMELNLRKGVIPNALFLENSLAQNLYFQDEDLRNSQTHTYTPENMLYDTVDMGYKQNSFRDKYETQHVLKLGGIDEQKMVVVEGASAISEIERNLALNVIQACLDAKISPLSLGYSLIDKIASNTDVGIQKERVSIRLRENHINILKVFIAKAIVRYLFLNGIKVNIERVSAIFDQYITPSVETQTNVLAKQVQFGIKSRHQAVKELNKDELSDDDIEIEYERIKEMATQVDYNVAQRGIDNVLKGEGVEE